MPTLYLLRHAKSSWDDPALADHERPLAPRGRKAAKRIRSHLQAERIRPELVICSSSRRTRETLQRIAPALRSSTRIEVEDELYAASAEELIARLRRLPDDLGSALVVGHNPGLEDLAVLLAAAGDGLARLQAKFPTAALATLATDRPWRELAPHEAELTAFVVPRDL